MKLSGTLLWGLWGQRCTTEQERSHREATIFSGISGVAAVSRLSLCPTLWPPLPTPVETRMRMPLCWAFWWGVGCNWSAINDGLCCVNMRTAHSWASEILLLEFLFHVFLPFLVLVSCWDPAGATLVDQWKGYSLPTLHLGTGGEGREEQRGMEVPGLAFWPQLQSTVSRSWGPHGQSSILGTFDCLYKQKTMFTDIPYPGHVKHTSTTTTHALKSLLSARCLVTIALSAVPSRMFVSLLSLELLWIYSSVMIWIWNVVQLGVEEPLRAVV